MKNNIILFTFFFASLSLCGQNVPWHAVLPAQFPTNASGQINGISRVSQMKFHPTDPNKMYAMSARGGLFISTNGGNNWTVAQGTDFMPSARLASVCIDYTNDSIIYIGAGDHDYYYNGSGVWKSVNGGQSFTQTALNNVLVVEMIMSPLSDSVIVAATDSGIFKTYNGGQTWTSKTAKTIRFDDMKKVESASSATLFACTTDSSLYRSYDFGETWVQLTNGIHLPAGITSGDGCRIGLTPADTGLVYLAMVANGGTIYKSVDGGNTFAAVKNTAPPYLTYYDDTVTSSTQGDYNFAFGVDRANPDLVYLVAQNVWRSMDGGVTWQQMSHWWAAVHTDMHQITVSPYNANQLWDMNDGGVWLSTDTGNTWAPVSNGLFGEEIYHGNCSPTRRDMISIGTQDNGELYADSTAWYTNRGGDWSPECAFDYRPNSDVVYYYNNVNRRAVNGGDEYYGLNLSELKALSFTRLNPNIAFAADSSIYRTDNLLADTPAWTMIDTLGIPVMAMHSDLTDTNRLYVITNNATFYTSANAMAASPVFTASTLPHATNGTAAITSIKGKPGIVYAVCNSKVYRSADTGTTWVNVSYNLPGVNQVNIISDEFYPDSELVFVASSNTVYYKTVNQTTWTLYSDSLPSRPSISDMSVYNDSTANAILRLALYGRCMWQIPIANLRPLHAVISADNTAACRGVPVTFADVSTGAVVSRKWAFPGGTPDTSSAPDPVVTYNSFGSYNATLTVYNASGDSSTATYSYFIVVDAGTALEIQQGFESDTFPPVGWSLVDVNNDGDSWLWDSTAGAYGTSNACAYFNNYNEDAGGRFNDMRTPRLDFTGYDSIWLTYDHAYRLYNDSNYIDSFEILISTDCGETFNPVVLIGGAQFATVPGQGSYTSPSPGDWQTDTVDLTAYAGASAILAFRNIGHYGNNLFIDNINISAAVAAIAGHDTTICAGGSATIGMSPVNGINYSWSPATGLTSASISNPTATPASSTSYVLTATQDSSGISATSTVNVYIAVAGDSIYARGDTLYAYRAEATYQWYLNGAALPGDTASYYISNSAGDYTLLTTDSLGCPGSSNHVLITSVQNITGNAINIFPNPASTTLHIEVSQTGDYMLQLRDVTGRLVQSLYFGSSTELDVSTLPRAVYIAEVRAKGEPVSSKTKVVLE